MPAPKEDALRILMAIAFYPRGGSAQVVRYLARALMDLGHRIQIVSGSLKDADPSADAETFFKGLPLVEMDYTEAARGFRAGLNPMSEQFQAPFPPSYEDKPAVPDRVFYKVGRGEMDGLVASWRRLLPPVVDRFRPDIAHLHHLNHLHLAAASLPSLQRTAKVTHLHGTELKMLEEMRSMAHDPGGLVSLWQGELRKAAAGTDRFITISSDNVARAKDLLALKDADVSFIPNGVDTDLFRPRNWPAPQKMAFLEELLVKSPRGWDESGVVGSIRYERTALDAFVARSGQPKPLLVFVGRFLAFKRVPLLMEAVARANRVFAAQGHDEPPYNLLVWGGVPGEWEGEHPYAAARRLGLNNAFFCGWLPHEVLARGLNLADVVVAPSYHEPFGQVFLEAMATAVPVIATRSGGPLSFVVGEGEKANGWFSQADDLESLAQAIIEAVSHESERRRRGQNALALATASYSWRSIAARFVQLYRQLLGTGSGRALPQ